MHILEVKIFMKIWKQFTRFLSSQERIIKERIMCLKEMLAARWFEEFLGSSWLGRN